MEQDKIMKKDTTTYIVATVKPWNIRIFHKRISKYTGHWILISDPKKLTPELVRKLKPRYIFFPHWSWLVPKEVLKATECVCFHETPLPYGRGGSPIQNMIVAGYATTKVSALRMEEGLDTGSVYLQKPLSLKDSAQEIFERTASIIADMIGIIVKKSSSPKPQKGKVVVFKRRTPAQSDIAALPRPSLERIYDLIRMLDAETYPHAFLEVSGLRFEFRHARKEKKRILADVSIVEKKS